MSNYSIFTRLRQEEGYVFYNNIFNNPVLFIDRINDHTKVHWVSFLDGLQRVILFTDDPMLASGAYTVGEAESVDTELVLSMQGIGLSLVNDPEQLEIVYISISKYVIVLYLLTLSNFTPFVFNITHFTFSSGIIWEQCKMGARRYKKIEGTKVLQLEECYQRYISEKMVSDEPVVPRVYIDEKVEVRFYKIIMMSLCDKRD